MTKLTKKQKALQGKVDSTKLYALNDALGLVKEAATAKFDLTLYVAEGLAGYDSALQLALRSVVADRVDRAAPRDRSIAPPQRDRRGQVEVAELLERVRDEGCVELSEVSALVESLGLDDAAVHDAFERIPGARYPVHHERPQRRDFRSLPPKDGPTYGTRVSAVPGAVRRLGAATRLPTSCCARRPSRVRTGRAHRSSVRSPGRECRPRSPPRAAQGCGPGRARWRS